MNASSSSANTGKDIALYKIEGNIVFPPDAKDIHDTQILVNEGEFVGIPRVDGSFVVAGIPSGSYIVSISSPRHIFDPVRVDITKNGKIRARKVNLVDPNKVDLVKYPLQFETHQKPNYFQKREVFNLMDVLSNPMLFTLIAPIVLFLFLLPKLQEQNPEMQQAVEQANNIFQPQWNVPDLTDICIRLFGEVRRQRPRRNNAR